MGDMNEILEVYLAYGINQDDIYSSDMLKAHELDNTLNTNFVSGYDETLRDRICISNSTN